MKDEIITGYTPELVKIEPAKDEVIVFNFNITSFEDESFRCDSVSVKKSELSELVNLIVSEGIALRVPTQEFAEALQTLNVEEEQILLLVKELLQEQIRLYDTSESVNSFQIGEQVMWLDKATRVGLMNSITIEKNAGKEVSTLWFENQRFEIPVDKAIQMLQIVELYAVECYNVTAKHLLEVKNLESLQEALHFDITSGYPEPVLFQ